MRTHRRRAIEYARRCLGSLRGDDSGIALIESLIAGTVVGIAALGLATMFARGEGIIAGEGDNRVAVYLAQQRVELARSQGYAALTAGTTTELFSRTMAAVGSDPFYTRTAAIDCVAANDYSTAVDCVANPTAAKRISVTVQSAPKEARDVVLRAVLANR